MKIKFLLPSLLLALLFADKTAAQAPTCNNLVYIALDQNCSHTILPVEMLEGPLYTNCIVQIDKTAPFGNGPWLDPVLGAADIGKTYQARVRHVPSGNSCWGNVKIEDKLPPVLDCNELSIVNLDGTGSATVPVAGLAVTATDACSSSTLTPTSFFYNCFDLGVQTIQLTARDVSGNSSTCSHTVLVTNSAACMTCVADCPSSLTVSYDVGNNQLLTAFQNNDLSVFDVYGDSYSEPICGFIDSTYVVDYQAGTAGQSWFSRKWAWSDGSGQPTVCEQLIVFPFSYTVTVQGKVFLDGDNDCLPDAGENGINRYGLVVTKLPSGNNQTIFPNPDGTYSAAIEFNVQDSAAQFHLSLPSNVNPVCPTALSIPNSTSNPTYHFDIGLQTYGDCPIMQVDLGNLNLRRCSNTVFNVNYCNVGLDTAYGAFVTIDLDSLIQLQSAELPFTVSGPEQLYTFQLGDVPPFHCSSIALTAFVSCDAPLGQTLCNNANIYPEVPCAGPWQDAQVSAESHCVGDSVSLELKNTGTEDMTTPLNYIVIEDFIMYKNGTFQLPAGDSVTIKAPANGSTWRIEAEQTPGFPIPGLVTAAIEGCGGLNTAGLINAFGISDNSISTDIYCGEIVGSFDPNDKTAVPGGYTEAHVIRPNQSIEYKIRFQNTGTDTAFQVVVVDTLPALLDASKLELGASSHSYRLEHYPGGILHFVFDPIVLPDSNHNEVASHGYLQFRIAQQPDLANETVIENQAYIYFDQNDPVLTNTAFHTIGFPFVPNIPLAAVTATTAPTCHGGSDGAIFVSATGGQTPYTFVWSNAALEGDSLQGLPAGNYSVTVQDSHGHSLVETYELTEPAPITLEIQSTPAVGNDDNGTATAQATGGTGALHYLWSNGTAAEGISGLQPGTYTVSVTDDRGCTTNSTVTILHNILPLDYHSTLLQPLCHGSDDGAIYLTVSGGLSPYSLLWNNSNLQGDTLENLVAGAYTLTLTDNTGNLFVETFLLQDPSPITINLEASPSIDNQNNGTASVTSFGGTGALAYLWNTGATDQNLTGLTPGVYTVTVTDMTGCSETSAIAVEQTVGVPEPSNLSQIHVWPNPAKDRLMLDLQQVLPQVTRLDVLSAEGRLLQQFHAADLQPLFMLDLENAQSSGIILILLHGRDGSHRMEKVIIR